MTKVGIIGAGKMGSGIFYFLISQPFELVWICSERTNLEKITKQFAKRIRRALETGTIDKARYDALVLTPVTPDLAALQDCDLVIEAITENLEEKQKLFGEIDRIIHKEAILTSNSSSINPSALLPGNDGLRQVAGLHFFYPVQVVDIVEITLPSGLTAGSVKKLESFLKTIGRSHITLDEQNSFILNRIFLEVQNAAFRIVKDGSCTFEQMDQLVKSNLFPFGIFDFCDAVGLDTMVIAIRNYTREYPQKAPYEEFIAALEKLVAAGKLGVKTHEGFYRYPLTDHTVEPPEYADDIEEHLRHTWLSACERFTASLPVPQQGMTHAIEEYFGISQDPLGKLLLNFNR
ncbi:MAG: 3-hydroxyacyl-CoA dehydrogenase family protein [Bacteroidota bacterium]